MAEKGINGFPTDFMSREEKKGKANLLNVAKATMKYAFGEKYNFLAKNKHYRFLRKEVMGKGNTDNLKSRLGYAGDTSLMNINWSKVTPLGNVIDKVVGKLSQQDYTVNLEAISPESKSQLDEVRDAAFKNYKTFLLLDAAEKMAGIDLKRPNEKFIETPEQLEEFMLLNAKTAAMVAGDKLLQNILDKVSPQVKEKIIRDLVVLGSASVQTSFDENENIIYSYVDRAEIGTSYTTDDEYRDLKFMWRRRQINFDQILQEATTPLTPTEIKNIIQSSCGVNGNPRWDNTWDSYFSNQSANGNYSMFSDFIVDVYDIRYKSITDIPYVMKKQKKGSGYFFEELKRYDPTIKKEGVDVITKKIGLAYEMVYIPSAEVLYNYGELKNTPRKIVNGAYSPMPDFDFTIIQPNMYDMENQSLAERLIPLSDNVAIAMLKLQQVINSSVPKGLSVDTAALATAIKGGNGEYWDVLDYQKVYKQIGTFYYSSYDDELGVPIQNQQPIRELENGMSNDLERYINLYNFNLRAMHDMVGFSEGVDSHQNAEKTLVGIQKAMARNNNNALRWVELAYETLHKTALQKCLCLLEYAIIVSDNTSPYELVIGEPLVKSVKALGDTPLSTLGVSLEVVPNYEKIEELRMYLLESVRVGTLLSGEMLRAIDMFRKSPTQAINYIAYREQKNLERKQQEAKQASEQNAMVQQASAAAKAQADAQLLNIKTQATILEEAEKRKTALEVEAKKHEYKLIELALEYDLKEDLVEVAKEDNPATAQGEDLSKTSISKDTQTREPSAIPSSPSKNVIPTS